MKKSSLIAILAVAATAVTAGPAPAKTSLSKGNNLHRNVIFRDNGDKALQVEPFTCVPPFGSINPLDLWKWMDSYERKTGGSVLAIAHNGNLSNGEMFPIVEAFGKAIDRDYVEWSNLQRQWLYEESDAESALPKAVAAARAIGRINSGVETAPVVADLTPDNIEGIQVGDSVFFHVTNLEQDWDVPHGFGMLGARNAELLIMPGATRTLVWVPQAVGVYPFYCTDFCSALHQEMQGYIRVSARGSSVPLTWNKPE